MTAIDRIVSPVDRTLAVIETAGMAALTLTALVVEVMQGVLRHVFSTGVA